MSLFGIDIHQSPIPLVRQVPIRKHIKRRNQSKAYHRRIQKKWAKRFGTKAEHYALMFNPSAAGLVGGPRLMLDARGMAMLRNIGGRT